VNFLVNSASVGSSTTGSYTTHVNASPVVIALRVVNFTIQAQYAGFNIGGITFTPTSPAAAVAPSIITQPASQTITSGQTAAFLGTASGTAPLTYQWQLNGSAIGGATSASYTTPAEVISDSGAQCSVEASNSAGSVASHMGKILAKVQRYKTAYGDLGLGGSDGQVYF
jgi:hypothetical protein